MKYIKLSVSILLATALSSAVALAFVDSLTDGNEVLNIEHVFNQQETKYNTETVSTIDNNKPIKKFAKVKVELTRQ